MPMVSGTKPITWNTVLIGLAKRIYDNKVNNNVYSGDEKISITIEDTTYTETNEARANRVLANKMDSWAQAQAVYDEITSNATVSTNVSTSINVVSVTGITSGPSVSGPGTGSGSGSGSGSVS